MRMIRIPALGCAVTNDRANDNYSHYGARLSSASVNANANDNDSHSAVALTECNISVTYSTVFKALYATVATRLDVLYGSPLIWQLLPAYRIELHSMGLCSMRNQVYLMGMGINIILYIQEHITLSFPIPFYPLLPCLYSPIYLPINRLTIAFTVAYTHPMTVYR